MTSNRLPLIGLGVFGVLALLGTLFLLRGNNAPTPPPNIGNTATAPAQTDTTTQYVAAREIPPRTQITRGMFSPQEVSRAELAPNAITDPNQLIGKLAGARILPGQTITGTLLTEPLQRVIPANFAVPQGLRAVAVFVDGNQTAAGLVDVGDRVDVIANHKFTVQKQSTEAYDQIIIGSADTTAGRTIAQDLQVLAVERSLAAPTPTPTPAANQQAPQAGAPAAPTPVPGPTTIPQAGTPAAKSRVILAAAPAVAERLVAANEGGTLYLTIRDPNSREQFPIPEAREYPTRLVNVPKKPVSKSATAQERKDTIELARTMFGRDTPGSQNLTPARPGPPLPVPRTSGNTGANTGTTTAIPEGPIGKEVTVIRGTEKTRVLVPGS